MLAIKVQRITLLGDRVNEAKFVRQKTFSRISDVLGQLLTNSVAMRRQRLEIFITVALLGASRPG